MHMPFFIACLLKSMYYVPGYMIYCILLSSCCIISKTSWKEQIIAMQMTVRWKPHHCATPTQLSLQKQSVPIATKGSCVVKSPLQSIEIVPINVLQMLAAAMTLSFSVLFVSLFSSQIFLLQLKSVIVEAKEELCRHSQQLTLVSTSQASHSLAKFKMVCKYHQLNSTSWEVKRVARG